MTKVVRFFALYCVVCNQYKVVCDRDRIQAKLTIMLPCMDIGSQGRIKPIVFEYIGSKFIFLLHFDAAVIKRRWSRLCAVKEIKLKTVKSIFEIIHIYCSRVFQTLLIFRRFIGNKSVICTKHALKLYPSSLFALGKLLSSSK